MRFLILFFIFFNFFVFSLKLKVKQDDAQQPADEANSDRVPNLNLNMLLSDNDPVYYERLTKDREEMKYNLKSLIQKYQNKKRNLLRVAGFQHGQLAKLTDMIQAQEKMLINLTN